MLVLTNCVAIYTFDMMASPQSRPAPDTIGETIASLRRSSDMTQDELAGVARVSRSTIAKLETGERLSSSTGTLSKIAAALGVPLAALFPPTRSRRGVA